MRRMRSRRSSGPPGVLLSLATILMVAAGGCSSPGGRPEASPPAPGHAAAVDMTPEVHALLAAIRASDGDQLAISEEDGRFLRLLVVASGSRRALEIGGASGYSAIWLGLALRETGGTLITIEQDPTRARELQANIRTAGLGGVVQVATGDAFDVIPTLEGTFDLVFLDAWKPDYLRFFELTYPRLDRGGLFLAHNVVNKRDEMLDFLETIEAHADLLTAIVSPADEGVSVSVKR
jgi:caffeoyl-CoA O-methyltransferase